MPNRTILVVDDEKEVTMTLKGLFMALGHQMFTALDGKEALKIIEEHSPTLILLDVKLPGVDGIQILKKVRKERPETKVIIMTAYSKDTKDELEKIGVDGFFEKPIDLNGLMDRIRFVLEASDGTRFYPSREVKEPEIKGIPKAKLLFIEPNPLVYGFTCALFNVKEIVKGEYETKVAYGAEEGMKHLYVFQPDIVIMYDSTYHMDDVKELAEIIMNQSHKPKVVILHGLVPKMDFEIRQLEKLGIKFCNQSALDNETFRVSNKKLVDFVAHECIRQGLVK